MKTQVLKLETTALQDDAEVLQELFQLDMEENSKNESTAILVGEGLVVLLVPSLSSILPSTAVYTTSESEILQRIIKIPQQEQHRVQKIPNDCSSSFCQVLLPSGSKLLLIPDTMLKSPSGRHALVHRLSSPNDRIEDCNNTLSTSNILEDEPDTDGEFVDLNLSVDEECTQQWTSAIAEDKVKEKDIEENTSFSKAVETNMNQSKATTEKTEPSIAVQTLQNINQHCPAFVDICLKGGDYQRFFAIRENDHIQLKYRSDCDELILGTGVPRVISNTFSSRMSSAERLRRSVGHARAHPICLSKQRLEILDNAKSLSLQNSLKRRLKATPRRPPLFKDIQTSSLVTRAMTEHHWVEEWAEVSTQHLSCYHVTTPNNPTFRLKLSDIMTVRSSADPHYPSLYFLHLETAIRTVCLMFADEVLCLDFHQSISKQMEMLPKEEFKGALASELTCKSSKWNCEQRQLLNCGILMMERPKASFYPLSLMEICLRQVIYLRDTPSPRGSRKWRDFLASVAALKRVDLLPLTERSRLVFFLNLYHTMVIHSYLVLGFPRGALNWISFFNGVGYEVGDDILSLTELEHCTIRAEMAMPSNFFSWLVLPISKYATALSQADFRINFALNPGSISNPSSIVIYKLDTLDRQLDEASRLCMERATFTKWESKGLAVELPKVCQWFSNDFGSSDQELLVMLKQFLKPEHRQILNTLWSTSKQGLDLDLVQIGYLAYNFQCRPLELTEKETELQKMFVLQSQVKEEVDLFTIS